MAALGEAMQQKLPDASDTRAEFTVDDVPYVFTSEPDATSIFVYAVIGALPQEEAAKASQSATGCHPLPSEQNHPPSMKI